MPRIYDSASNPIDFCVDCFPSEEEAKDKFADVGDGPDSRGNCFAWDAEHPPYEGEEYRCNKCNILLLSEDDYY